MPSIRASVGLTATTLLLTLAACQAATAEPKPGAPPLVVPRELLIQDQAIPTHTEWTPARDSALSRLVALAKVDGGRPLGFDKTPQLNQLYVLNPFPESFIHIEELKYYQPTTDPASLIHLSRRLTFPVLLNKAPTPRRATEPPPTAVVVSSFTLSQVGGTWKAVSFGSPSVIRAAMKVRIRLLTTPSPGLFLGKSANYSLVLVHGLNQYFLSTMGPLGLYLIPLYDNPRYGFAAGHPVLARAALQALVADANALNGLPT